MPAPRFLQLADVAEVLNISANQVYALVRRGDIPAVKIGGRGQWRVEATELEKYIERLYTETSSSSTPIRSAKRPSSRRTCATSTLQRRRRLSGGVRRRRAWVGTRRTL